MKNAGRTFATWILALLVMQAASCAGQPGGFVKESGDVGSLGGAPSILWTEDDGGGGGLDADVAQTDTATVGKVGTPCLQKEECVTDFCMTTENIGGFIKGALVANGYCSALFCAVDGSDGACTAEMGGMCFSLFPFLPDSGDSGICLSPCDSDADCRTSDDNLCFDAQELVNKGLIDPSIITQYYSSGSRGCLPRTVAEAAIIKLTPQ
jgi:hypothetical protein